MKKKLKGSSYSPHRSSSFILWLCLHSGGPIKRKYDGADSEALFDRDTEAALNDTNNFKGQQVLENEKEFQRKQLAAQDEVMDEIGDGAAQLHEISVEMGKELKSQTVMLEDVNDKTGSLKKRTDLSHQKVIDMIENMNSCRKYGLMLFLFVLFLILLFVTIYTWIDDDMRRAAPDWPGFRILL